jgi:hypothetical protein
MSGSLQACVNAMFRLMGALGRTMAVLEAQLMAEKRN